MDDDVGARVDRYVDELFGGDATIDAAFARSTAAGLPPIQVARAQGRLLAVLVRATGARRVLEVGTLAGISAIWMGRALPPGGRLVTLEVEPRHAEVARANLDEAGLRDVVDVRVGPALEVLAALADEGAEPFDLVFIDADKPPYAEYLEASLRLARPGTVIVADNVIRRGAVAEPSDDAAVAGARRFNALVAAHPRLDAAILQTVGEKHHDGMAVAVVRDADAGHDADAAVADEAGLLDLTPDELLTTTRAVRKRLDLGRSVDPHLIAECLEVALQAPSGGNVQRAHFVVVTRPDLRLALAELYRRSYAAYRASTRYPTVTAPSDAERAATQQRVASSADHLAEHLHEVPVLLVPCVRGRPPEAAAALASFYGSVLPAVWSFALAARARGLGTCWTTLHLAYEEEAAEILGIPPADVTQVALLPVAHVVGERFGTAPRPPLGDVVSWDSWDARGAAPPT